MIVNMPPQQRRPSSGEIILNPRSLRRLLFSKSCSFTLLITSQGFINNHVCASVLFPSLSVFDSFHFLSLSLSLSGVRAHTHTTHTHTHIHTHTHTHTHLPPGISLYLPLHSPSRQCIPSEFILAQKFSKGSQEGANTALTRWKACSVFQALLS